MSYAGKLELKLRAQKLRARGLSIKEIEKKLKVSRSSVSLWVRNIKLTKKQIKRLYVNKKTGSLKGSYIAAMNKIRRKKELTKTMIKSGEKEVGNISNRDKFVAGIAMYFAEGTKNSNNVSFSNSDPRAIKFMADWFRKICKVQNEKIRCDLYIHDNLDEIKAKEYWSNLIRVPLEQFRKSYIVKNNTNRLRKVKHIYGVFRITVSDANLNRKIMGWVSGLFKNKRI